MKLILGLGNPGERYQNTRHNIGVLVLQSLLRELSLSWSKKGKIYSAISNTDGVEFALIKTSYFMNESGKCLPRLFRDFNVEDLQDIMVLVDDVYLPLGKVRYRTQGSSGGHNGLLSLEEQLNSTEFPRLRLGVGGPEDSSGLKDYVLDEFLSEDVPLLEGVVEKASQCVLSWASGAPSEEIMQKFN